MVLVKLESSDGKIVEINEDLLHNFGIITELLKLTGSHQSNEVIKLPNITTAILEECVEWAKHHKNEFLIPNRMPWLADERQISEWDTSFFEKNDEVLLEIISAANYLNLEGLMDASCKYLSRILQGRYPQEIRMMFKIKNDFSSKDSKKLKKVDKIKFNFEWHNLP